MIGSDLHGEVMQVDHVLIGSAGQLPPQRIDVVPVRRQIPSAVVGEPERAAGLGLLGPHQPLVLELL